MSENAQPSATLETAAADPAAETVIETAALEQETKPGLLERISASLQSKTALLAEVAGYRGRAETAEAALEEACADLAAARKTLEEFTAERTAITARLDALTSESASTAAAAAKIVATIGFPAADLPAAESEPPASKEQLMAKMDAETDSTKRYALAEQINSMN